MNQLLTTKTIFIMKKFFFLAIGSCLFTVMGSAAPNSFDAVDKFKTEMTDHLASALAPVEFTVFAATTFSVDRIAPAATFTAADQNELLTLSPRMIPWYKQRTNMLADIPRTAESESWREKLFDPTLRHLPENKFNQEIKNDPECTILNS